jgi:plasmid stabilization system protein ParE
MLVEITDEAIEDLLRIARNLREFSPAQALEFIERYESAFRHLRRFPMGGQMMSSRQGWRVWRSGPYRFVYEWRNDRVLIVEIRDGRAERDLP